MFNLRKHKQAQVTSHEKMLRRDNVGSIADDQHSLTEKALQHSGYEDVITERQFKHNAAESKVIEKALNEATSYVVHRSDASHLSVPPINVLVEKMQQERLKNYWKTNQDSHWSQTINEREQQGELPQFSKNAPQHDKLVLNNDPRRFEGNNSMPIYEDQTKNDALHGKQQEIKPLVGNITLSDINNIVEKIKTGASIDYDTAIVAILREADKEQRELTPEEQRAVTKLKIARTKAMLVK